MLALTAQKLWQLLEKQDRRNIAALLGLMLIGMALETLSVGLVLPLIALLTDSNYAARFSPLAKFLEFAGNPQKETLIFGTLAALFFVYLFKNLYLAFQARRQTFFSFCIQVRLSQRLFASYLGQPYSFHLQHNSAQLIRNIITEVNYITGRVILPGLQMTTELLGVVGIFTLLLVFDPVSAFSVTTVLATIAFAFHNFTRARISHWGRMRQRHEGLRIQHLVQGLGGVKEIKLLGRETYFQNVFDHHNLVSACAGRHHAVLQLMPSLGLEVLAVFGVVVVVALAMLRGDSLVSVIPAVGLFAAVAFRLIPSTNRILLAIQSIRYGMPSIEVVHSELCRASIKGPRGTITLTRFNREIRLLDVTFTYPAKSRASLRGVSMTVRRGESIGILGISGSGKSTLVNVILGLLEPDLGSVEVDGVDIRCDLRGWQDQIGYVPQSVFLADDTLLNNIAYGIPEQEVDHAAVIRAVSAAQLDSFVSSLAQGLGTEVGERGVRISGGQLQRIGIARALYHNPSVLVLDEATSSLDPATETGVMQVVKTLHGQKTLFIVAHRMSTLEQCDRLYHLNDGHLVNWPAGQAVPDATSFHKLKGFNKTRQPNAR